MPGRQNHISDDHVRYHTLDPDTSREAAARLSTGQTDQRHLLTIHVHEAQRLGCRYTGLADFEAGHLAGMERHGATKRLAELRDSGLLAFTAERRTNPESNRPNAVSILTARGAEEYCRLYLIEPSGPLAELITRDCEPQGRLW